MTTYSKSDLATRILRDLGLAGAEETPSDTDLSWAEETIQAEMAILEGKNIKLWNTSDTAIPHQYYTLLSRRIGLAVAPSFGISDIATAQMAMAAVEMDLRILGAKNPTGAVAEAEYF